MGIVLGISMGFDQLTKEKEDGTLKHLLTCPVYRDTVLTGKVLGGMCVLFLTMFNVFALTIAMLLFYGIVLDANIFLRIVCFLLLSILYSVTFYIISLLASVVSKDSAMSVICTICLVTALVIFSIIAPMLSNGLAGLVSPQGSATSSASQVSDSQNYPGASDSARHTAQRNATAAQLHTIFSLVSPLSNFGGVGGIGASDVLLSTQKAASAFSLPGSPARTVEASVIDSLSYVWMKILAMVVEPVLILLACYLFFMRLDA